MIAEPTVRAHPLAPDLARDVIRQTLAAAVERGSATIAAIPFEVPADIDLLDLFSANVATPGPKVFWHQQSRGFSLVGLGEVAVAEGHGPGRFAAVSEAVREMLDPVVSDAATRRDVRCLGGFAFDDDHRPTSTWRDFPGAALWLPRWLVVEDRAGARGVACVPIESGADAEAELARLTATLADLLEDARGRARFADRPVHAGPVCLDDVPSETAWKDAVGTAVEETRAGRLRKVVLARSTSFDAPTPFSVEPAIAGLRAANPTATVFAVTRGRSTFVGATPELLVRLGERRFETVALAGTIARGATPDDDLRLARQLLASQKDRIEHEIVVETILDALRPVSRDVRRAEGTPRVERSKSVQHLSTPISGTLDGDRTVLDLVGRLHPTPAVGGAPRDPALAFIREHEHLDRGWYAGPVGWVDAAGGGEFAVALRSGVVTGTRATIFAGGGVVADSLPESEFAETAIKLRPMLDALGIAL